MDRDSHTSITSVYDVFLSFRGPDARYGIVDHLYECMTGAGLRVFKDDEEIRRGEVIGGELERAIRGSRVYVVVFSRNYASSAWCLRELDMMVDLHRGSNVGKKIILPIFYGADPADVKLRTELYREPLDKHKGRHGEEVVKKWEEALKTVGSIKGWDCKAIQGEGRFVRLIVQDIIKDKIMAARSFWRVLYRYFSFYLSVAFLVLFYINKKEGIRTTDVWITYFLLAVVIALDAASEIMLTFSNWSLYKDYLGLQILCGCIIPFLFSILLFTVKIFFYIRQQM